MRGALLVPRFDCAPDHHQTLICPWHRPLNQKQIPLGIDAQYFQVLNRYPVVARAACHPHPFEHPSRRRARTDRAWSAQPVRLAVGFWTAPETVALDHTLKASALRRAGDIDQFAFGEGVRGDDLSHCNVRSVAGLHFAQGPRHEPACLAVSPLGPVQALVETESKLDRAIAVLVGSLDLRHNAGTHFKDRHRVGQPRVIKYLGHAQLFSDKPLDHWLSPVSQEAAQLPSRVRPQSVSSAFGRTIVRPRATTTT